MAIGNHSDLSQTPAEITCIPGKLLYLIATRFGTIFAHDDAHRGVDLLHNGWRNGASIAVGVAIGAQEVNEFLERETVKINGMIMETNSARTHLGASNVATSTAKTLGECAHQNVHIFGIGLKVIDNTTPIGTHRTNTVCLIQIQIRLVFLL